MKEGCRGIEGSGSFQHSSDGKICDQVEKNEVTRSKSGALAKPLKETLNKPTIIKLTLNHGPKKHATVATWMGTQLDTLWMTMRGVGDFTLAAVSGVFREGTILVQNVRSANRGNEAADHAARTRWPPK